MLSRVARARRPWLPRLVRLLLTAAGLCNETLRGALRDLLGKPYESANMVYIPTASNVMSGDRWWFVKEVNQLYDLGWAEFNVLELNGPPRQMVLHRLMHADVIYVGGGNNYHLARSITGNGLADGFLQALESRVYVGISAGSMIFSRNFNRHSVDVFEDTEDLHLLGATTLEPPFGIFDWYLKPHLYSPAFPHMDDAWADRMAERADFPIYFIDDESAVCVNGEKVEVLSEGRWRFIA